MQLGLIFGPQHPFIQKNSIQHYNSFKVIQNGGIIQLLYLCCYHHVTKSDSRKYCILLVLGFLGLFIQECNLGVTFHSNF